MVRPMMPCVARRRRARGNRFWPKRCKTLASSVEQDKTSAYSSNANHLHACAHKRCPDIQVYRPINFRLHPGTQRAQHQSCTGPTQPSTSQAGRRHDALRLIRSNNRCHRLCGHVASDTTTVRRPRRHGRRHRRGNASVRREDVRERHVSASSCLRVDAVGRVDAVEARAR
jgi:hypothetical protein